MDYLDKMTAKDSAKGDYLDRVAAPPLDTLPSHTPGDSLIPAQDTRREVMGISRQGTRVFKTPEETRQAAGELAGTAVSAVMGVGKGATLGLLDTDAASKAMPSLGMTPNPVAEGIGEIAGTLLPWEAAAKGVQVATGLNNLTRAGRVATQGATGAIVGGVSAQNRGEDATIGATAGATFATALTAAFEAPGIGRELKQWWNTRQAWKHNEERGLIVRDFQNLKDSGYDDVEAVRILSGKREWQTPSTGEIARFSPEARAAATEARQSTEFGRRDIVPEPIPETPTGRSLLVPEKQPVTASPEARPLGDLETVKPKIPASSTPGDYLDNIPTPQAPVSVTAESPTIPAPQEQAAPATPSSVRTVDYLDAYQQNPAAQEVQPAQTDSANLPESVAAVDSVTPEPLTFSPDNRAQLTPSQWQTLEAVKSDMVEGRGDLPTDSGQQQKTLTAINKALRGNVLTAGQQSIISKLHQGRQATGTAAFNPDSEFRRPIEEPTEPTEAAEPVKRSDIVKLLQEKLDVPIRTGRFRQKALGIFKTTPGVVRTRFANDIETIAHEIGHGLHKFLWPESVRNGKFNANPFTQFSDELTPIASIPNAASTHEAEGFAEFLRLYVTNKKVAQAKAPRFYAHFETLLDSRAPEVKAILQHAESEYDRWAKQPAMSRVLAQISTGVKKPGKNIKELLHDSYTATVDDLHPLRSIVQEMTGGQELPAAKDPYKLARLLRGWYGKADAFLEYKPFNFNTYEWGGKSLREILEPVENLDELRGYLVARRAVELGKRGIDAGIAMTDAQKVVTTYGGKYGNIAEELYEFQNTVLHYLRDSGVISSRSFQKMKTANQSYVPFYRVFEGETSSNGRKIGMEANDPTRKIKGSHRDIADPLESIIKNTYVMINTAEKNAVGLALTDLAKKEGMGKFMEKIPAPMQGLKVSLSEIVDTLPDDARELLEELGIVDETATVFRPSAFSPQGNVISVFDKGQRQFYEVHPDIFRAVKALDRESVNAVIRMLSYPARWLRAGATLSPEFMARNPIRDQFSAFVFSKYGFVPGYDLARGIFHTLKNDEMYWQWKQSGGQHAMLVSLDREYLQKSIQEVMHGKGAVEYLKNPIEILRVLSEIGEEGTRVGEFSLGVNKEGATKAGKQNAAFASREVTLDFARMGAKTKAINMIVAFWNAQIQGIDRAAREFKDNPGGTLAKVFFAITLPSVLLVAANRDDKRWAEIPQWQKDLFWIVLTKDQIYRIPKPFELGIIFGTVPERITEYALSRDPAAFDGLMKTVGSGSMPGWMPTAALPFVENWANKSMFTGGDIVPRNREEFPAQYQYKHQTTETAKKIGEIMSRIAGDDSPLASPAKIENLVKGWSGGLGKHALNVADRALQSAGVLPEKITPSKTLADVPFVQAFIVRYPGTDAASIQRFYDNSERSRGRLSAGKALLKESDKSGVNLLTGREAVKVDGITKALSRMHQLVDTTYHNPDLSADEKREIIDRTYMQMIEVAKAGNKLFKK